MEAMLRGGVKLGTLLLPQVYAVVATVASQVVILFYSL